MNLLKSLARKILKEEPENDKYHFEKLGNENLAKSRLIKELESDNKRLRIKIHAFLKMKSKCLDSDSLLRWNVSLNVFIIISLIFAYIIDSKTGL